MSKPPCKSGSMKKQRTYCPVVLEPELEEETALMTASQRRALAEKFRRWARQLDVSAFIMMRDQRLACGPKPAPGLKAVAAQILIRN